MRKREGKHSRGTIPALAGGLSGEETLAQQMLEQPVAPHGPVSYPHLVHHKGGQRRDGWISKGKCCVVLVLFVLIEVHNRGTYCIY